VAPGAAGWIDSKASGVRQLIEIVMNSYPRPIPSALESSRLGRDGRWQNYYSRLQHLPRAPSDGRDFARNFEDSRHCRTDLEGPETMTLNVNVRT
jgi:hypothetical protein